jgi:quercetin dioxygenase-like cupin family protein
MKHAPVRPWTVVALVCIVAVFAVGRVASGVAQESATPTGPAPITIQTLGSGQPSNSPGNAILLLRITLQPGAAFPPHIHPGALVIAVESGDFAFTVFKGEADATRAIATGTPEPTEKLTAGQEVVFHAGDEIFEQAGVVHTARNAGNTPAVVLVAGLVDPTQPFLQPMSDMSGMGTPTS